MRAKDKIREIERFLNELKDILPASFEEYKENLEKKAACERYLEKIVEAVIDLAFLVIKSKKLKIPEDDVDALNILINTKIINEKLAKRLKNAKGMRNIIAHQYGKVEDDVVFDAITKELARDADLFIKSVKKLIPQ